MKRLCLSLVTLSAVFGAGYSYSSECIDEDCVIENISEFESVELQEPIAEPISEPEAVVLWSIDDFDDSFYLEEEPLCEYDYTCPFDTAAECEIWRKKPIYNESAYPRAPHLNPVYMDNMIYSLNAYNNVSANDSAFAPLVERYKMLMRASKSCCESGIIHKMNNKKISDKKIYRFLQDDANIFAVTHRCLVMNNDDIVDEYSNGVDGEMVTGVRNVCICKNRDWFTALLQPFKDLYERVPEFENMPFNYTYIDGLQRDITISINQDVQNTLNLIDNCPD